MEELPLPPPDSPFWTPAFDRLVLGLCGRSAWFANEWLESVPDQLKSIHAWRSWWADSFAERQRRRAVIDAVVAHAYGVTLEDVEWLLRDCFHPCEYYSNRSNRGGLDQKGFWRVDEHLPVSTRHTWLFLQAYKELKRVLDTGLPPTEAVDKMVGKVPGEGWILPEESAASFCERGEDQRTAGRDQTPLESWEEVMNHKKELYETPLWTGALA
jgi:hypothetical protein